MTAITLIVENVPPLNNNTFLWQPDDDKLNRAVVLMDWQNREFTRGFRAVKFESCEPPGAA